MAAALLLLAAVFLDVFVIEVNGLPCQPADPALQDRCSGNGSLALVPLALLIAFMAIGAGPGRSRSAGLAVAAGAVAVLVIVLGRDLPKLGETGAIGFNFEQAASAPGPGFWVELAGGVLALAAGLLALLRVRS